MFLFKVFVMLKVLITIDVETSIGGAFDSPNSLRPVGAERHIFGKIGSTEYGIPRIMDILPKGKAEHDRHQTLPTTLRVSGE